MKDSAVNSSSEPSASENASGIIPEILAEIRRREKPSSNVLAGLALLAVSLFIFYQAQILSASVSGIGMLLAVLLVHEAGHFIAMKLFGYRDLRMFFIPFLGAAVTGKEQNPGSAKRAVVSLMGPVPGLVLGFAALCVYNATGNTLFRSYGYLSLALNAFNLLPIYPLDGGRFFETVLFSRHAFVELVFRIIGIALLVLCGAAFKSKALVFFALLLSLSLRQSYLIARLASKFRKEGVLPGSGSAVSETFVRTAYPRIDAVTKSAAVSPRKAADTIITLWNRLRITPPTALKCAGWIAGYFMFIVVLVVSVSFARLYAPVAADEWMPFTSQDGRFTVEFPGVPLDRPLPAADANGKVVFVQSPFAFFSVTYSDISSVSAAKFLTAEPAAVASAFRGSLAGETDIALGEIRGKDFSVDLPGGKGTVRSRLFIDGNRCYKVFVLSKKGILEKEKGRFFESFRIVTLVQ